MNEKEKASKDVEGAPVSMVEEDEDVEQPISNHAQGAPLIDWDNGLVGWESEADPLNPVLVPRISIVFLLGHQLTIRRNWSSMKKALIMSFIAVISTLRLFNSSPPSYKFTLTIIYQQPFGILNGCPRYRPNIS
jgi:hypothetical protein